ncbi:hypothetical protein [Geothrix sp. 21YS21S-4]|uniref:hypothetical protein n=1 Tax=Geothrix sp. 21YS21S-4 TaxID=3068889 RepID=UPI0027B9B34C|nr:hypothetical protein [Geothrix sp. 21YS21S-4]
MASTLRDLLIQRAARLQDRPALTAPDWGTLSYARLRNRAEGVAFGLLAEPHPTAGWFSSTGTPWDWMAELAVAASGLAWDPAGMPVPPEILGGSRFNLDAGRGLYHAREQTVAEDTPFAAGLAHGEFMTRLRRLNRILEWDHESAVELPLARLGEPPLRAALWSLLYAGGHAILQSLPVWNPTPFEELWLPER